MSTGRAFLERGAPYVRRGVESGAVAATVGGVGVLGGLRAFVAGERESGRTRLVLGAAFLTAALLQRRSDSRGGEPRVDAIADESGGAREDAHAGGEHVHAAGETAQETATPTQDVEEVGSVVESRAHTDAEPASSDQGGIIDTGVDHENLAEAVERATEDAGGGVEPSAEQTAQEGTDVGDVTETEEFDRLGAAAFDSQSREVPVPQRAFNQGILAHSTMVCWGVRERDDAVLIAQDYDAIQGRDGVKYVASSEIGTDVRELPIPDPVLNHWDEVIRGGMAVTGGDDILFVTTDRLAADGLLRVLPAEWADDLAA